MYTYTKLLGAYTSECLHEHINKHRLGFQVLSQVILMCPVTLGLHALVRNVRLDS